MPRIVRLYLRSAIAGFIAAGAFTGLVLWLNVANLGHLVMTSDVAIMAVVVFWVLNGIVFSGVQFAWAITAMAEKPDDDQGGKRDAIPAMTGDPVPVLAAAEGPTRTR